MMIARSFEDLRLDRPVLLTIGTFDGVHRGHRLLLEQAVRRAKERQLELAIVTFDPSPAIVLRPGLRRYQLSAPDIKLRLLAEFDPACVLLLPFTVELSRLSADEFMDALESRLPVHELWLGEDFHFGRDREGDSRMLAERGLRSGFALHVVERRADDPGGISSSRIRKALAEGDVDLALRLLGYPFCLEVQAPQRTETVGALSLRAYAVPDALAVPASGVYAVLVSGSGDSQVPAACLVNADAPLPLKVVGDYDVSGPILVEFIARMSAEAPTPGALIDRYHGAVAIAAAWSRTAYPASGRHD